VPKPSRKRGIGKRAPGPHAARRELPLLLRGLDPLVELPVLTALTLGPWLAGADTDVAGPVLDAWLGLALTGCAAAMVARRRAFRPVRTGQAAAIALWLLLAALATVRTRDIGYSIADLARVVAAAACFVIPLAAAADDRRPVALRLAVAAVAGAVIAAGSGVTQWLRNVAVFGAMDWRTFGTFQNPNALAGFLVLTAPVAAALALAQRERAGRMLGWFVTLLLAGTVPLTHSRTGIGALVVAAFVLVLLALPGSAGRRLAVAGACAVGLTAVMFAIPTLRERFVSSFTDNHSLMFRVYCWKAAAAAVSDRPLLGWGPGTYSIAHLAAAQVGYTTHAHNDLLHVAAECGVPAALAVAATFAIAIRAAGARGTGSLLTYGAAAGLVALLFHGLMDTDLNIRPTLWTAMALIAGVQLAHGERCGRPAGRHPDSSGRPAGRPYGYLTAGLGLFACVVGVCATTSGALGRQAQEAERSGILTYAASQYRRAYAWYPFDATPLRKAAVCDGSAVRDPMASFAPALHRNPWRVQNYRVLGDLLTVQGRYAEARAAYDGGLEIAPLFTALIVGRAACAQALGDTDGAAADMRLLASLEDAPYGRYKAIPEMASLEFLYPPAALAELEPGASDPEAVLVRLDAYAKARSQAEAAFAKQAGHERWLIELMLSGRGFTPARTRQVDRMRARMLYLEAQGSEDRDELLRQARRADPPAVAAMERGEWQGLLVETAADRAEGGL